MLMRVCLSLLENIVETTMVEYLWCCQMPDVVSLRLGSMLKGRDHFCPVVLFCSAGFGILYSTIIDYIFKPLSSFLRIISKMFTHLSMFISH